MTGVRGPTHVLILPVLGKHWLYAVEETLSDLKPGPSWRQGKTLFEKAILGKSQLVQSAHVRLLTQWEDIKSSPKGSLKNWLHRLAQKVLDQEDVVETFLKRLPAKTNHYEIIFPSDLKEKLVRRRTRLFLQQQEYYQRCRQIMWGSLVVPMMPFALLPAPNVPLYYALYKAYSHTLALRGCRQLLKTLDNPHSDTETVLAAAARSASAAHSTVSSPLSDADLAAAAPKIEATVESSAEPKALQPADDSHSSHAGNTTGSGEPKCTFGMVGDKDLAAMLKHSQGDHRAVTEHTAERIGERLGFPSLPGLLKRMLPAVQKL